MELLCNSSTTALIRRTGWSKGILAKISSGNRLGDFKLSDLNIIYVFLIV